MLAPAIRAVDIANFVGLAVVFKKAKTSAGRKFRHRVIALQSFLKKQAPKLRAGLLPAKNSGLRLHQRPCMADE